ncbi:UDP-N-acetylmuramoyl-L-alanine--D-glutamate ligase [Bifidobacterium scaligerum]|uniref:UDP-N-acetylmuramoylalanine--D-glutamate ligase n=1 Tax=Bifidobacterium scaligerum TaxID=2052656 RepID=A0A2M9HS24_9BIFI|nr:UDP-N-acetylmuramoyl-L-alanine--D-glutamate ligase [Bifidobacterium scaligerum]PJM79616.1 UDP-N-acetylmuramoyl-L-alanine--D-glutamate ligase [Bifidobacterium scaligerum]
MQVAGTTVVIAGLGVSGTSLAQVLRERGAHVIGVDERKPEADLKSFDEVDWQNVDYVMASPVFNPRTPFIVEAQRRGIPVMSEVEFAWRLRVDNVRTGKPAPWIGITGTNGKTSTTEMTSAMLTACGLDAPTAGNIASGDMSMSLSRCATNPEHDVLCVELSSFQLHFTDSLELECAAITNIADDHLDWHGGRERYAADKAKVFHRARKVVVYNAQDAQVTALALAAETAEGCRKVGFTLEPPEAGQIGIADGWIVDKSGVAGGSAESPRRLAPIREFTHLAEPDGSLYPHLVADALTALALVLGHGADLDTALAALREFKPGGHRIQTVAEAKLADGTVRFVDDSKATNAHAAHASLSSFPAKSVIWIAGGLAKGSRFEDLVKNQAHTIKAAVIIGRDQAPMIEAFASQAPEIPTTVIDPTDNATVMDRAVEAAGNYAAGGDVVLMAPACASMDQFVSYADRGNRFAKAAKTWSEVHGLH